MDSRFTIDLIQPISIDLNQPPPFDHEEGDIPITATYSSSEHLIIELNEDNHVTGYPVIEINLREIIEDIDGAFSDSSDEEIDARQMTEAINGTQTSQGVELFLLTQYS